MVSRVVVTRDEARAVGVKRFYTGDACKRGHITERYVSTGFCVQCDKEAKRVRSKKGRSLSGVAPNVEVKFLAKKDAAIHGHMMFVNGKECKRGHTGPRYVSSGACVACIMEKNATKKEAGHVMDAASYVSRMSVLDGSRFNDSGTVERSATDYDRGRLDAFIEAIGVVVFMRITGKSLEAVEKVLTERGRAIEAGKS